MFLQAGVLFGLVLGASAQAVGKEQTETHPKMTWKKCTSSSCTSQSGEVTIDANWRWLHGTSDTKNCYDGNKWTDKCSSATDCTTKCALEGATYSKTYGASTSGDALTLKFVTKHEYGTNIGSRFYLMSGASKYQMFTLMNNEFTFDVDLSTVDCGLNAALYFVAMDEDGGMKKYSSNKAGAKYGTGYCDAQCARDLKFVGGKVSRSYYRRRLLSFGANIYRGNRPMPKVGRHPPTMLMPGWDPMAPAVLKSMCGNPTRIPLLSHPTLARPTSTMSAKQVLAVERTRKTDSPANVTQMAVTITRTGWVSRTFTAKARPLTLGKSSRKCGF
jgi:hypothetical protein